MPLQVHSPLYSILEVGKSTFEGINIAPEMWQIRPVCLPISLTVHRSPFVTRQGTKSNLKMSQGTRHVKFVWFWVILEVHRGYGSGILGHGVGFKNTMILFLLFNESFPMVNLFQNVESWSSSGRQFDLRFGYASPFKVLTWICCGLFSASNIGDDDDDDGDIVCSVRFSISEQASAECIFQSVIFTTNVLLFHNRRRFERCQRPG